MRGKSFASEISSIERAISPKCSARLLFAACFSAVLIAVAIPTIAAATPKSTKTDDAKISLADAFSDDLKGMINGLAEFIPTLTQKFIDFSTKAGPKISKRLRFRLLRPLLPQALKAKDL